MCSECSPLPRPDSLDPSAGRNVWARTRRVWRNKLHAGVLGRGGGKNRGFVARDDPSELKRRENQALAELAYGGLRCCECGMVAQVTRFWRAYLTDDDPPQAVVYCPACASRERVGRSAIRSRTP